jgi:hypothetical protein
MLTHFFYIHDQNTNIQTLEIADFNNNFESRICTSVDQRANEIHLYHNGISPLNEKKLGGEWNQQECV